MTYFLFVGIHDSFFRPFRIFLNFFSRLKASILTTRTPILTSRTPILATRTPILTTRTPILTTRIQVLLTRTLLLITASQLIFQTLYGVRDSPRRMESRTVRESPTRRISHTVKMYCVRNYPYSHFLGSAFS